MNDNLKEYLEYLYDEGKDDKTISAYTTSLKQFIVWLDGSVDEIDFNKVKPVKIKEYQGYLIHQKNRKQATVNKATAALKSFFGYLSDTGKINDNPMTRIKIQRINNSTQTNKGTKWLTKEEQHKFFSYVELEEVAWLKYRNLTIIDLMLYAGLRANEVSMLKIVDIFPDELKGFSIMIREGKGGKSATVTLVKQYTRNLKKWMKIRAQMPKIIHAESPYLFVSERSEQLTRPSINKMLNKYANLAHMENINPHRFRHSFCKNLANTGTPIELIRKLARHESIQTTTIYIDPSNEEMLAALNKM